MIIKTRHVLAVPDLQRSLAYYRDVLGFDIVEIGDDGWRFFILAPSRSWQATAPARSHH